MRTVCADAADDGTVWIAEDVDRADSLLLTGRFSGYLDGDGRVQDEFEDLAAEDAIEWGRARAAKVLIRTGDSGRYFSAGERNPNPRRFQEWPPSDLRLEPRRPSGFEALDNTERDPPTLWDVYISADLPGARGRQARSAAFLVEASTLEQAREMANRILSDALAALAEELPASDGQGLVAGAEVYPHPPGKPVSGPGVTY
jgi:hypothetical protein